MKSEKASQQLPNPQRKIHTEMYFQNENTFSVLLVEIVIFIFMLILAIHVPLTILAQSIRLPFKIYLNASLFVILFCLLYSVKVFRKEVKTIQRFDTSIILLLIALGILGMVISLITNRPDTDDYYYVPNVVYYLDNPVQHMDFAWHFFANQEHFPITSYNQGTSLTYDYMRATPAHFLQIHYLDVYYIYSVALMGFIVVLAAYLLMSKFTENTIQTLIGTVFYVVLLLVLTEVHRTFGNFAFPRIYQGKAVMLSISIPVFIAYSLSFFSNHSSKNWIALFATTTASIGMTTSAALLIPSLAMILWGTLWALNRFHMSASFLRSGYLYLLTCGGAILYLLLTLVEVKSQNTSIQPFDISGPEDFVGHVKLLINPHYPLTPVLVVLFTVCCLFLVHGWQRNFILAWSVIIMIIFLNPLSASFLIDTIIPRNIYWRFFYLYPFPLLGAIVSERSWRFLEKRLSLASRIITVVVIFLISLVLYLAHFYEQGQIQPPGYKLPSIDLKYAQEISAIAPAGIMLSPPNLYGIIPMINSKNPQVLIREDGASIMSNEEWMLRSRASAFTSGQMEFFDSFLTLVDRGQVDVIVLRSKILNGNFGESIKRALKLHGYINRIRIDTYTIISRQSR